MIVWHSNRDARRSRSVRVPLSQLFQMIERKRSGAPLRIGKTACHVIMPFFERNKDRRGRVSLPERRDDFEGVRTSECSSARDRVSGREEDAAYHVEIAVNSGAKDLKHGLCVVPSDEDLCVPAAFEQHGKRGGCPDAGVVNFDVCHFLDDVHRGGANADVVLCRLYLDPNGSHATFAELVSGILQSQCKDNDDDDDDDSVEALFRSKRSPSAATPPPLLDYMNRFIYMTQSTPLLPLLALLYVKRATATGCIRFTYSTAHRMLLAALITAHKFLEDDAFDDRALAKTGGVSVDELELLERVFIGALRWRLFAGLGELCALLCEEV